MALQCRHREQGKFPLGGSDKKWRGGLWISVLTTESLKFLTRLWAKIGGFLNACPTVGSLDRIFQCFSTDFLIPLQIGEKVVARTSREPLGLAGLGVRREVLSTSRTLCRQSSKNLPSYPLDLKRVHKSAACSSNAWSELQILLTRSSWLYGNPLFRPVGRLPIDFSVHTVRLCYKYIEKRYRFRTGFTGKFYRWHSRVKMSFKPL